MTCGITPKISSFIFEPPEDLIASRGPSSIPSITSDDSFPSVPIEWIPKANVPVNAPRPVIGRNTKASINSGKARIAFNICLVILLTAPTATFCAAKNETGKLKIAPITVPAHAINRDSNTFGMILSIASWLVSNGNIAPTSIPICLGASKILSIVISSPAADHNEAKTIAVVKVYFKILWLIGCLGMFIIFFFLSIHWTVRLI